MNQLKNTLYWLYFLFLIINLIYIKNTTFLYNSIVVIIMEDNKEQFYLSSGFFVYLTKICTNYHVIKNKKGSYIKFPNRKTKYEIINITAIDIKHDLAIIGISQNLNPYILSLNSNSNNINKNTKINIISNSGKNEDIIIRGIVNNIIGNVYIDSIRKLSFNNIIGTTAKTTLDSSRSPILNNKNEIIAINKNSSFAISSNYLKSLVETL